MVPARILQLPLRLAWASACHEVQGQTFPDGHKVVIKWDRCLQSGMAYVMLSISRNPNDINNRSVNLSQIRRNAEAKLMRDFLQMPERSPTSTANILVIVLSRHSVDLQADHLVLTADILILIETWLECGYPVLQILPKILLDEHIKDGRGRCLSIYSCDKDTQFQLT